MGESSLKSIQNNRSEVLELDLTQIMDEGASGSYRLIKWFRVDGDEMRVIIPFEYQ